MWSCIGAGLLGYPAQMIYPTLGQLQLVPCVSTINDSALYRVCLAAMIAHALSLGAIAGLPRRCAFCKLFRALVHALQRYTLALKGPGWSTMQPMTCRMIGCAQAGHPGATPCSCWAAATAPYGGSPAADGCYCLGTYSALCCIHVSYLLYGFSLLRLLQHVGM